MKIIMTLLASLSFAALAQPTLTELGFEVVPCGEFKEFNLVDGQEGVTCYVSEEEVAISDLDEAFANVEGVKTTYDYMNGEEVGEPINATYETDTYGVWVVFGLAAIEVDFEVFEEVD